MSSRATIVDLDVSLVEDILAQADPIDVASFAQTSRVFRNVVYDPPDDRLWRLLYLGQPLDDPRTCVSQNGRRRTHIRWRPELERIIRARTVLSTPGRWETQTVENQVEILRTLVDLVAYVPPTNDGQPTESSDISPNLVWVAVTLRRSTVLDLDLAEPAYTTSDPRRRDGPLDEEGARKEEVAQLCARLHTYFGLTKQDFWPLHRLASRAYVYMFRRYTFANRFGPYYGEKELGINWVHVKALHHLISLQAMGVEEADIVPADFEYLVYPLSMSFTQIVLPVMTEESEEKDWAGVRGTWQISFCFIDHRRLLEYNRLDAAPEQPLDLSVFSASDFGEVFRTLQVELRITSTTPNERFPDRPTLSFAGTVHNNYTLTGSVEMASMGSSTTPEWGSGELDGVVQWHFVSGEEGRAVWSSEGIQVGGLGSAFGVLGAWTTVFHDDDDPVGPFWMRKVPAGGVRVVG